VFHSIAATYISIASVRKEVSSVNYVKLICAIAFLLAGRYQSLTSHVYNISTSVWYMSLNKDVQMTF